MITFEYKSEYLNGVKIRMELDSTEADIPTLCEEFSRFLMAIGYVIDPITQEIALVEKDTVGNYPGGV